MGGVTGRKVLVIGDDTRSFLVIVRSLGRRGITVHAAPTNFRSSALRSRYISAIHYLPPWTGNDAGSYSLQSLGARGEVQVVADDTLLRQLLSKCAPDEALLEQYFAGRGIGISVLASSGRILQAFEHHRVREFAGASFHRRSAPLTPDLAGACDTIVANLKCTGIIMFESKLGPTGDWVLLEVNARPWGSMPLPVALGVDFPYRWWQLVTAGEETPAVPYHTGVYGRDLMPDLNILRLEAGARPLGPMTTVGFMIGHIAELSRLPTRREVNDVLVRDDPCPGLIELAKTARAISWWIKGLLPGAAAGRCRHARAQVEALQPGRATPIFGVEAAAEYGVDLSSHRSSG